MAAFQGAHLGRVQDFLNCGLTAPGSRLWLGSRALFLTVLHLQGLLTAVVQVVALGMLCVQVFFDVAVGTPAGPGMPHPLLYIKGPILWKNKFSSFFFNSL